jgi:hypothetical protein
MDGEIATPIQQRLMDFLGEEALSANLGQAARLDRIARGDDLVFLKRILATRQGTEARDQAEEMPGLV